MNRITAFSVFLVFTYGILLLAFKIAGYTIAAIFAQPSQFYLLVLPLGIILFVFQMVMIWMTKGSGWRIWTFKGLSTALTLITVPMIIALPWTYILFGSYLQIFITTVIIALLLATIAFVWIEKKTNKTL